jgi:hypothetical protein
MNNKVNVGLLSLEPLWRHFFFLVLVLDVVLLQGSYSPAEFSTVCLNAAVESSYWTQLRMTVALPNIANKK